jgi:hypothetical protein
MSVFRSSDGNEWRICLDAFLLDEIKKSTGIDLADLSAGGWWTLETDAGAVGRVLAIVCGDEVRARKIESRLFVRTIRGQAIADGRAALLSEGADFFPPSEWSAIQSSLEKRRTNQTATTDLTTLEPMLRAIALMPEDMRLGATEALREAILAAGTDTSSPALPDSVSAFGLDGIPLSFATDSPASAELPPAA